MTATYIIDGQIIDTVRYDEVELIESAEFGNVGQSSIVIDDTTGTQLVTGLKAFEATESDCEDTRTLRGFVGSRTYERGVAEASNARTIRVTISDLNDLLAQRALTMRAAKRPQETVSQRVTWLLSTDALGDLVSAGRVQTSSEKMDRTDHRNSFPGDVLAECALAAGGFNYYIYQDPTTGDAKLAFRDENASGSNASVLRISNVWASIGSNTFAPMDDATLVRSPESVFSRAILTYAKGTVVEERAATASNYRRRDGIAPNSNVRTAERASKQARAFLWQHHTEEDVVECEIEVPGGAVNLVHAGDRIQCQFGHWGPEGYSSWNYFRVLERRVRPQLSAAAPAIYRVHLRLTPQEPAEPTCSYARTASGTYYPLGGPRNDPPPLDGYSNGNPSDGVVYYLRPGIFYPTVPTVGAQSMWHFPQWGSTGGGAGTTDFAGDCVANTLQFIVVGNGTGALQTKIFGGSSRPMAGSWGPPSNPYKNSLGTFTSGDLIEFTISDTSAPSDCVRVIRFNDGPGSPCGGKWGWSSFVWTQT